MKEAQAMSTEQNIQYTIDTQSILVEIETLIHTESDSQKYIKLIWARDLLTEYLESSNDYMDAD
jgi:hypothetical protein